MPEANERNLRYRGIPDWEFVRSHHVVRPSDIAADWTLASISRDKSSHRGIGKQRHLKTLFASAVNQEFLDEICELEELEYLWLGWPITAHDLSRMAGLDKLRFLKVDSPRNVTDFQVLTDLPALRQLFVENAKHLTGLEWLEPLKDRLWALGIEGGMWTTQRVPGLSPLAGFTFEALFLTSTRLKNKDLTPLAACPNLRYLACARFAPKSHFDELERLRPDIYCTWFESYEF